MFSCIHRAAATGMIIFSLNQLNHEIELSGRIYAVTGAAASILENGAAKPYVLKPCE